MTTVHTFAQIENKFEPYMLGDRVSVEIYSINAGNGSAKDLIHTHGGTLRGYKTTRTSVSWTFEEDEKWELVALDYSTYKVKWIPPASAITKTSGPSVPNVKGQL